MASKSIQRIWLGLVLLAASSVGLVFWQLTAPPEQPTPNTKEFVLELENGLLTASKDGNWAHYAEFFPPSGRQYLKPGKFAAKPRAGYAMETWEILDIMLARLPGPDGVPVDGYAVRVRCSGTHVEDREAVVQEEFTDLWGPEEGGWYYRGRR